MTLDPRNQGALRPITPPVSASVIRRGGWFNDVVKPMAQSAAVGLAVVNLAASFLVLCVVAGSTAFWIASGCVAASSFLWSLASVSWRRMDGGDRLLHLFATGLLTGLTGYIAQCVAVVATWGIPAGFLKVPPFVALLWFAFSVWYFPHLEVSLAQRLAVPSMFQDRYLWRALASWVEWRLKKEPVRNGRQPMVKGGLPTKPSAVPEPYEPPPEAQRTEIEHFLTLAIEWDTIKRETNRAGPGLMGKIKPNGRELSKPDWEDGIAWLKQYGHIEKRGKSYEWKPGVTAEALLKQFEY